MDQQLLLSKMSESKCVYIIERLVEWKRFYLFDIDEEDDVGYVVWTPNIKQSLAFIVEEEVEEVKASYRSLKSSIIVRISKDELSKLGA